MAKAKKSNKKKNASKTAGSKAVALEKKTDSVETAEEQTEKKESAKEAKTSEKKSSDKKSAGKKAPEKKPSVFARIAKYFRECNSERKKIVWPTVKTTFKNMGIVLSVLIVLGLFVYGLDTGFIALLKLIMDI